MKTFDTITETMNGEVAARMKNPTRWLQRMIRKTAEGVEEAGKRLATAVTNVTGAIDRTIANAPPLAVEILTVWVRQVILTAIEFGIGRLVRRFTARPKPTLVIAFPTTESAP